MANNGHAHAKSDLYGLSVTSNLQTLKHRQISVTWSSEGEVSSHTGGREAVQGSLLLRSAVIALVSCLYRKRGWISLCLQTTLCFGPPMKLPSSNLRNMQTPAELKAGRESHKTVVEERRKERGTSVACVPKEGSIAKLNKQTTTKHSDGDRCDKPAE